MNAPENPRATPPGLCLGRRPGQAILFDDVARLLVTSTGNRVATVVLEVYGHRGEPVVLCKFGALEILPGVRVHLLWASNGQCNFLCVAPRAVNIAREELTR